MTQAKTLKDGHDMVLADFQQFNAGGFKDTQERLQKEKQKKIDENLKEVY